MEFLLRFDKSQIPYWTARYFYPSEAEIENEIAPRTQRQGYYTCPDFLKVCEWKSARIRPLVETNSEEFVRAVTETALSTNNEELRLRVLTLLHGVSWPVASVLLHFGSTDRYPILDFRAMWSVGAESYRYNFDTWIAYTLYCRSLADECGVTMRELDRALWQYSKENQR